MVGGALWVSSSLITYAPQLRIAHFIEDQLTEASIDAPPLGHVWLAPNDIWKPVKTNALTKLVVLTQWVITDWEPSFQAEVAMSGRVCQPNIRHPSFSSTLYPSPPANSAKSMLACLNALEPRWTGVKPAESNRVLHWAKVSCLSTRSTPSHATTLNICFPKYISDIILSWLLTDPSSESNRVE